MKCMFTQVTQCVSHNMANSRQICSAGICSLSSDVGGEEAIQQRLVILYNLCNPYCLHCDAVCAICNLRACRNSQCVNRLAICGTTTPWENTITSTWCRSWQIFCLSNKNVLKPTWDVTITSASHHISKHQWTISQGKMHFLPTLGGISKMWKSRRQFLSTAGNKAIKGEWTGNVWTWWQERHRAA